MRIKQSVGSRIMDIGIAAFLFLLVLIAIYPLWHVVCVSFSSQTGYLRSPIMLWPQDFNVEAYRKILTYPTLASSYKVTIFVTIFGTLTNLVLTVMLAYPLSKKSLKGTSAILLMIVFSMIFKPALLPKFLVVRQLGLYDTLAALFLPTAVEAFNLILMKNFFASLPESFEESAFIDGASEYRVLWSIIIPLSKSSIATIGLFYAVFHWNNYFSGVVYIKSMNKWPLQLLLREVVMSNNIDSVVGGQGMNDLVDVMPFTIQMATVVVTVVPILLVYPFIQKYFVTGIQLGGVKE